MTKPTIDQLQNSGDYELIAKINHHEIKEFVVDQLTGKGKIIRAYMIYQFLMILSGMIFLGRSVILAFDNNLIPLYISLATLVFSFSILIVIHELLHGIALKVVGAKKIRFGAYLKKFTFYAEADRFVLNRKQFALVALAPLLIIQAITLLGILLFLNQPILYFWMILMSTHSLFCAGDIGLLSLFYKHENSEVYTFDVKAEKTSYYYKKRSPEESLDEL